MDHKGIFAYSAVYIQVVSSEKIVGGRGGIIWILHWLSNPDSNTNFFEWFFRLVAVLFHSLSSIVMFVSERSVWWQQYIYITSLLCYIILIDNNNSLMKNAIIFLLQDFGSWNPYPCAVMKRKDLSRYLVLVSDRDAQVSFWFVAG